MFEKIKELLVRLIQPAVATEVERRLRDFAMQTERRTQDEIERRVVTVEQQFERRLQRARISFLAGIFVSVATVLVTYVSVWHQFIREKHMLNGYVLTALSNEDRSSAEIVFSNEGNQTEVISGGNFIYTQTNNAGWQAYHSSGTNSVPPIVLKAGDKAHLVVAEALFKPVQPPFRLGILLYTLSNGVPIKVPYTLGRVTKAWSYLTTENGKAITADNAAITVDATGTLFDRSNIITITLLDHRTRFPF